MEIIRSIASITTAASMAFTAEVLPVQSQSQHSFEVGASCINADTGKVIEIDVNARGYQRFNADKGSLYLYFADLTARRGYIWVGFENNPDSFTASMQGQINSLAGQGSIPFESGHTYSLMLRRGSDILDVPPMGLPYTDFVDQAQVSIDCDSPLNP